MPPPRRGDSLNLATVGVGTISRNGVTADSPSSHVVVDHLGDFQ